MRSNRGQREVDAVTAGCCDCVGGVTTPASLVAAATPAAKMMQAAKTRATTLTADRGTTSERRGCDRFG
jgi:hypothetical protein